MPESKSTFVRDRGLEQKMMPCFKKRLAPMLGVNEEDLDWDNFEDTRHATDLMVERKDGQILRIAVRCRTYGYFQTYPDQYTIRYARPSGNPSEFDKIMNGWGNLFLYGFSNPMQTDLTYWFLGNLDVFRKFMYWVNEIYGMDTYLSCRKHRNKFPDSDFLAFSQNETEALSGGGGFVITDSEKWDGGQVW